MSDVDFPITISFIALNTIVIAMMIGWIGIYRGKINILRGDGGDTDLFKRSRIHGNLTEIAPIAIFSVGVGEALKLSPESLWSVVILFFVGRMLHYISYDHKIRGAWMGMSSLPPAAIGIWSLFQVF